MNRKTFVSFSPQISSQGFTMLEITVVIAIISILIMAVSMLQPRYVVKAQDGQRKADLNRLKIALEDYAGDHECYPPANLLAMCGSDALAPYLQVMVCDPATNSSYMYVRSEDCLSYGIYTQLENTSDVAISESGCASGCGPDTNGDEIGDYNYGIGSGSLEEVDSGEVAPTCPNAQGVLTCISGGSCGSCCPGVAYKCNSQGDACVPDSSCQYGTRAL